MKYNKFIIHNYRGICKKTEIDISKESLIPIIGKNESGKTTFLEAIVSFDNNNDEEHGGRHLKQVENLYSTDDTPIKVEAEIEIPKNYSWFPIFQDYLKEYEKDYFESNENIKDLKFLEIELDSVDSEIDNDFKYKNWAFVLAYQILTKSKSDKLRITRELLNDEYQCDNLIGLIDGEVNDEICREILNQLPYILYFDDFRDRLPEKIYIVKDSANSLYTSWIKYINELFAKTKDQYSVFTLSDTNSNKRKSIIKEVQKELNEKLINEWSKYQFEKTDNIEIQIEYFEADIPYLKFSIEEKINVGGVSHERYFNISDRSKGFYWYLNFMLKLHYNPQKRNNDDKDTIYLLDEPGSYLHTYALSKLAEQLKKISLNNKVIYCTHSHNLLNPEVIPINSIRLAEKSEGTISLKGINHKEVIRPSKNSAYQSIFDALEVRPPMLEYSQNNIVLLEGIYDFYCFEMFSEKKKLSYFPCVSASSIINQIPYMIFLGKKYLALWDNDKEGRSRLKKAQEIFGDFEGQKFLTLDLVESKTNTTIEDILNLEEYLKYFKVDKINKENFKKKYTRIILSEK